MLAGLVPLGSSGTVGMPTSASDCPVNSGYRAAACGPPVECLSQTMWVDVPGQGLSCPSSGHLWWVRLSNGAYAQTHGSDREPRSASPSSSSSSGAAGYTAASPPGTGATLGTAADPYTGGPSYTEPPTPQFPGYWIGGQYDYAYSAPPVKCAGATTYRQELVYAISKDLSNPVSGVDMYNHGATFPEITGNRDALIKTLRQQVSEINWWLFENAMVHGANRTYNFQCDATGKVAVVHAVLPTSNALASWGSIAGDLATMGYNDPHIKYWVYYAATPGTIPPGVAGQGTACPDDRLVLSNCSNTGPMYAVDYNFNRYNDGWAFEGEVLVMMHESGHTLGAVQNSAPHSSLGAHCNDGYDVMCYADGGANQCSAANNNLGTDGLHCMTNCINFDSGPVNGGMPIMVYDCGGEDYFNPAAPLGNYLYNHWNIGSPMDRFLAVGRPTACADGRDNNGNTLSDSSDIGCADARDDSEDFSCPLNGVNDNLGLGFSFTGLTCLDPGNPDVCNHQPSFSPTVADVWHAVCNPGGIVRLPVRS